MTVNGKRVKVRRVGRRGVRVSLRGRPKGRYRIRVKAKTSRKRTIRLDRRARTCAPKTKKRRGEARAAGGCAARAAVAAAPAAAQLRPGLRGEQLLQDQRARGDPLHARVQGAARAGQRRQRRRGGAASQAADPERQFVGQTCAGAGARAARATRGSTTGWPRATARSQPVVFTARNGATLSGRVWSTRERAGEAARRRDHQRLGAGARDAVLVRRPDAGQGRLRGADLRPAEPGPLGLARRGARRRRRASRPRATAARSSTAPRTRWTSSSRPRRRPTCRGRAATPARRTRAKQDAPGAEGRNAAFNPLHGLIDTARIGIAGHSFGAAGVSYVGQRDPRVKAVVAWDALRSRSPTACAARSAAASTRPSARRRAITKPALNLTADYFIPPTPNTVAAGLRGEGGGLEGVQRGGRRHGLDRDPRRHPLRVLLDPRPGVPGRAARRGPDHLVHDGLVRRLPQGRPDRVPAAAHGPLAHRRAVGRRRPGRRREHDVALLPLAAGHRPRRRALRVRGPARGLPGPARRRRRAAGLRLPLDRDHAGRRRRPPAGPGGAPSCVAAAAVQGAAARPRGRGVRFAVAAAHDRRGVPPDAARADHAPAARRPLPAPLARLHVERPGDAPRPPRARGRRLLRALPRGAAARSSTSRSRAAPAAASCAAARSARSRAAARSATPRSRGRCSAAAARKPLDIRFRLNTRRARRGHRPRAASASSAASRPATARAGRTIRLRLPARAAARAAPTA